MAGIGDYFDELGDIFAELFIRDKTREEKSYHMSIRKQRQLKAKVGKEKAKIVKDAMLKIGFNSITDKDTMDVVCDLYELLKWDKDTAKEYLDKYFLARRSINDSRRKQFSIFNKNRKVDNLKILKQIVNLLESDDLTSNEINLIIEACESTGSEIDDAKEIYILERQRLIDDGFNDENSIEEEAAKFYKYMIELTSLTTDTTLKDAREVIGRGRYPFKERGIIKTIRSLPQSGASKISKKLPENNQADVDMSVPEINVVEEISGLDYNEADINKLIDAILRGAETDKQIYNGSLKSAARIFKETCNSDECEFAIDEHKKRARKKGATIIAVIGLAIAGFFVHSSKSKVNDTEPNQATESVVEDTESIPSDSESVSTESGITPTAANAATAFRQSNIYKLTIGKDTAKVDWENGKVTYQIGAGQEEEETRV